MRSHRQYRSSWQDASDERFSKRDEFNETLPQQSSRRETPNRRASRLPLPSVRPLNSGPRLSSSGSNELHRLDPVQEQEFYAAGALPPRRRTASIASSRQSNASLAPSSLRYLGRTPTAQFSPVNLIGSHEAVGVPRRSSVSQAVAETPPRFRPRSPSPTLSTSRALSANETRASNLHPLLKQALLLIAAAEVEDRLAIQQENTDAFDDILALFSVAKEVEAIRVAAFDMFELEAKARRALCAQQKRERHTLWLWYLESLNNALLSREVRVLQLEGGRAPFRQSASLLRSRSASLQPSSYDLFNRLHAQPASPAPVPPRLLLAHTKEAARPLPSSSPKRQLSYPPRSSPRDVPERDRHDSKSQDSMSSSSYSYSVSTASSPSRREEKASQSLESVYVNAEQMSPSHKGYTAASESALDDRIARQQVLLASGEPSRRSQTSLLFPQRAAPRTPPKGYR